MDKFLKRKHDFDSDSEKYIYNFKNNTHNIENKNKRSVDTVPMVILILGSLIYIYRYLVENSQNPLYVVCGEKLCNSAIIAAKLN